MNETIQKAWDAAKSLVSPKTVEAPVEATAAPARGADGKFAPKEPTQEPVASEPQESGTKEETTAVKPPSAKALKERTKALTALQRAKIPQSIRDTLDDDKLIAWGAELAEVQAREDRRRREGKEPSKDPELEEASGSPGEEADSESETDETQESEPRVAAEMQRDILAVQARTELGEDFPGLKDAATWRRVRAHARDTWMNSDAYDHYEDHFEGACAAIRDASVALGVGRAASKVTSSVRDASQPSGSRPGDRFAAYKGLSPHDLTMRLLGEGKAPNDVRRIVEEVHAAR